MPKVFLIEEPRVGISVEAALAYGELQYVFDSNVRRSSVFKIDTFGQQILDRLNQLKFDYQNDFIVMTGSLVPIAVASIVIVCAYPHVHLLFYNAAQEEYVSRKISRFDWEGPYESKNPESDVQTSSDGEMS